MTRSGFSPLLAEGLREVYFDTLDLNTLVYPQIFDIKKSNKKTETDHSVTGIGMLTEKLEGESTDYEDFVDGKQNIAVVKSQIINGENLNSNLSMATLNKQAQAVQLQRLISVTAC
jgi:hypothetical protein